MSTCCSYCKLYTTLKESRLGFWTVVEPVAYFATVNTSIIFTTFVEFISKQSLFGRVPRVVIIFGTTSLPFHIIVKRHRLDMPLKVCFSILGQSPRSLAIGGTFIATTSKVAVTARAL